VSVTLGKEDYTGVDFVVLQRPKKVDVRGYLNYTGEVDDCPLSKVKDAYVELFKVDEEDQAVLKSIGVSLSCQFVFRHLENMRYTIRVYEKAQKGNTIPKLLTEASFDLTDDREINGGVKILKLNVDKVKRNNSDNLNYTIYSPIFLFLMVFSILKYDYTMWVFNNILALPFTLINKVLPSK